MQDGRSRKPFLWVSANKEEDFNLTELIHSVERKIWGVIHYLFPPEN